MVRAGSRQAARRLVSRGVSRSRARNPIVRSGVTEKKYNPRAPRGKDKKLPTALQLVVEEVISGSIFQSLPSIFNVPTNAAMCVVGEKKIEFKVYAHNQSNIGLPCQLNFFLYDIDKKEVESLINGPFGYLQPNSRVEFILYIPEMLYSGRKVLVTHQDNTDTRVSDVFYSIEKN